MSDPNEDALWVVKCLRGDAQAFNPLVRKYQRVLFTVARRLVGDHEDALDVTQNVFVRAYEKLETYDPSRRFFSWIYRIAVNESLNLRRARKSSEPLNESWQPPAAPQTRSKRRSDVRGSMRPSAN